MLLNLGCRYWQCKRVWEFASSEKLVNLPGDTIVEELVAQAGRDELGTILLRQHPRVAFGMQKTVNLAKYQRLDQFHLPVR